MNLILRIIYTVCIVSISWLFFVFISFYVIYPLIIPDPEMHGITNEQEGALFTLFFEISSDTGFHPEPSWLNFFITYFTGILAGAIFSYRFIWKNKISDLPISG